MKLFKDDAISWMFTLLFDLKHRNHVKDVVLSKATSNHCPRCGSEMVLRQTKQSKNKGQQFGDVQLFPSVER